MLLLFGYGVASAAVSLNFGETSIVFEAKKTIVFEDEKIVVFEGKKTVTE